MAKHEEMDVPQLMLGGIPVGTEEPSAPVRMRTPRPVIVTDVQIPFGSLVSFLMKCALASVPALLLLFLIAQLVIGAAARLFR